MVIVIVAFLRAVTSAITEIVLPKLYPPGMNRKLTTTPLPAPPLAEIALLPRGSFTRRKARLLGTELITSPITSPAGTTTTFEAPE
jgi:hypothetical protein